MDRAALEQLALKALGEATHRRKPKSSVSRACKSSPTWVSRVKMIGEFPPVGKSQTTAPTWTKREREVAVRMQAGDVVAVAMYTYAFNTDTKGSGHVTWAKRTGGAPLNMSETDFATILPEFIKLWVGWSPRDVGVVNKPDRFFVTISCVPGNVKAPEPAVADKESDGAAAFAAVYHALPDDSLTVAQRLMLP